MRIRQPNNFVTTNFPTKGLAAFETSIFPLSFQVVREPLAYIAGGRQIWNSYPNLKKAKFKYSAFQLLKLLNFLLREASHIDFVHEKRHTDVLLETPPPPLETSRTCFDY